MSIRRLTVDDAEEVVSIFLQHRKFQNLPKAALMASIYDDTNNPLSLFDRQMMEIIPVDLQNPQCHWYGNFAEDGTLICYQKFKFWFDSDINESAWTRSIMCKNKDAEVHYTYGQTKVPDEILDITNHIVDIAENQGIQIGYDLYPNAVTGDHPNAFYGTHDEITDSSKYRLTTARYTRTVVEEIPAGQFSTYEKFRLNVATVRFSVKQKIVRLTRTSSP